MRPDSQNEPGSLLIAGVHTESEGYPNVTIRLRRLREEFGSAVSEISFPFRPPEFESHAVRASGKARFFPSVARLAIAHFNVLFRLLRAPSVDCVYVPYPAALLLYLLSFWPRRLRPGFIVADVFISMYDTIVTDRGLVPTESLRARMVRHLETRAYSCADIVVADTDESAQYLSSWFNIPRERIVVTPLSTDETTFRYIPYCPAGDVVRVLFVGTFVPLQGVETIIDAARLLRNQGNIRFTLIGDGQVGATIEKALRADPLPNLTWIRNWQPPARIAENIAGADICLGIFGVGDKTTRVWPLKNYAYMSVGRPLITADTPCARSLAAQYREPAFITCPPGKPEFLAARIQELAQDAATRSRLAESGHRLYRERLAVEIGISRLATAIRARFAAIQPAR